MLLIPILHPHICSALTERHKLTFTGCLWKSMWETEEMRVQGEEGVLFEAFLNSNVKKKINLLCNVLCILAKNVHNVTEPKVTNKVFSLENCDFYKNLQIFHEFSPNCCPVSVRETSCKQKLFDTEVCRNCRSEQWSQLFALLLVGGSCIYHCSLFSFDLMSIRATSELMSPSPHSQRIEFQHLVTKDI